jgi:type VI secretion system protein ImpC
LHIELIDISQDELLPKQAELTKLLAGLPVGESPWSVVAGLFTFSPEERDCALLARLGAIARQAGAPFIASIHPRLFGCESIAGTPDPDDWKTPLALENAQAWQRLRHAPDANWIGLAFPRFLLRLPYGKKTSPIESFDFEEMPHPPTHDSYLWGNPAIACAALLGESFNQQGWDMRPGSINRLDGLPVHSFATMDPTPTAEIWMTERFAATILDAGVMPLASVKHSDAVLLVRFQSIAYSAQPLAGPW